MKKILLLIIISFSGLARYDVILNVCGSAQGNGYNWASTLSWLSTSLLNAYEEARALEARGMRVGIRASCFSGASSGSGVATVYDAVLSNSNLADDYQDGYGHFTRRAPDRILSPDEALRASKTLRYIALGADFDTLFTASTIARISIQNLGNIARVGRDNIWGEQMSGRTVAVDFATYILFGRFVPWDVINEELTMGEGILAEFQFRDFSSPDVVRALSAMGRVTDLLDISEEVFNSLSEQDLKKLRELFQTVSAHIQTRLQDTNREIYDHFGDRRYVLRRMENPNPNAETFNSNPLQRVLAEKPGNGSMTLTLAMLFNSEDELNTARSTGAEFDFADLRTLVFMNEETANAILSSPEYQELVRTGDEFTKRFMIAVVDQKFYQLNPSIREPGLLNALYGRFDNKLGIKAIYDPQGVRRLSFELNSHLADRSAFVIGGFPYEEINSWITNLYHLQVPRLLAEEGVDVTDIRSISNLFGSTAQDTRRDSTFAARQLRSSLFNQGDENGIGFRNIDEWERWVAAWYESVVPYMNEHGVHIIRTKMDWDIRPTPAALFGLSRVLVSKGHNATIDGIEASRSTTSFSRAMFMRSTAINRAFDPELSGPPIGRLRSCINSIKHTVTELTGFFR